MEQRDMRGVYNLFLHIYIYICPFDINTRTLFLKYLTAVAVAKRMRRCDV